MREPAVDPDLPAAANGGATLAPSAPDSAIAGASPPSRAREFWRAYVQNRGALVGLVLVGLLVTWIYLILSLVMIGDRAMT